MDFENILSLAAQNSSSKQVKKKYSAQLGPPVKKKKDKDVKSDVVKKLIEEKEREKREAEEARERIKRKIREAEERKKREKELKIKREKEEEERRKKEEEKKNRFRIPKKGENSSGAEKNEIKPSTSNCTSSTSSPSSSNGKSSESKRQETELRKQKSDKKDPKRISKVSDKVKSISSSKSGSEKLDPTTVKPTALSSNQRNSHLYDEIEKRKVSNETDIERKRREFEEKRARLLQQIKTKGLEKEKPVISKKTEKVKSSKDSDKKSERKKSEKPLEQVKTVEKSSLTNSKNGAIFAKPDSSKKVSVNEKIKSHNSGKKIPPPLGFGDLLKLAQVKASEPVTIESVKKAEKKEPERLMTKEERERFMEEQACKYRKLSVPGKPQSSGEKTLSRRENNEKVSKHSRDKLVRDNREERSAPKLKGLLTNGVGTNLQASGKVNLTSEKSQLKRKSDIMSSTHSPSSKMISNSKSSSSLRRPGDLSDAKKRRLDSPSTSKSSPSAGPSSTRPSGPSGRPNGQSSKSAQSQRAYDCENENVLVCGPPRPKPEAALNPFDRIYGQIKKNNPKPEIRKRRIESDEEEEESEYDEEMEGFITDEGSDLEEAYSQDMDYSKHIRQIFGYDKRKYKYESDRDIANMESNFAQQMKEEARSARLGLQEDLEDIKREEEELKRKMEKKKKK